MTEFEQYAAVEELGDKIGYERMMEIASAVLCFKRSDKEEEKAISYVAVPISDVKEEKESSVRERVEKNIRELRKSMQEKIFLKTVLYPLPLFKKDKIIKEFLKNFELHSVEEKEFYNENMYVVIENRQVVVNFLDRNNFDLMNEVKNFFERTK